jgi:hypothetical protein
VYKTLVEAGIAVPHHIVVNREGLEPGQDPPGFIQEVRVARGFGTKLNCGRSLYVEAGGG